MHREVKRPQKKPQSCCFPKQRTGAWLARNHVSRSVVLSLLPCLCVHTHFVLWAELGTVGDWWRDRNKAELEGAGQGKSCQRPHRVLTFALSGTRDCSHTSTCCSPPPFQCSQPSLGAGPRARILTYLRAPGSPCPAAQSRERGITQTASMQRGAKNPAPAP